MTTTMTVTPRIASQPIPPFITALSQGEHDAAFPRSLTASCAAYRTRAR